MPFTVPLTLATWLAPLGAFAICWLTLAFLLQRAARLPMDHPNARSLHAIPTPRVGGIGIVIAVGIASMLIQSRALWPFMLGAFMLAVISLLDDYKNLPVLWRLLAHVAVAIAVVILFSGSDGVNMLLAILVIVWMTNLYNFMDGADGLAGGMAVIGFGALGVAAWWAGAPQLAWFCASIAAAALAFLRFNFPPARLFMGDAGSIPLGFLAAAIGVYGVAQSYWPVLFPVIIFSPFILDASVTLIKRAAHGEKIWRAHHDHYYQRLVRMGWGHRKMTLAAYVLMLLCAMAGLLLIQKPDAAGLLTLLWAAGYLLLFITLDWRWSHLKHEI
jgi:UDP-GlcNAc:undecaprenyl-phosphate GlcNAc-1-phosphate transferase